MKKILLATTALVGFAGAAAAEVKLSGYAEIGVAGGENVETQFWNDIDVKFELSGESDSGLSFGATIDLDELNGDNIAPTAGGNGCGSLPTSGPASHNPGCENDSSVWVSGTFGKVVLGDTDGALDWAATELTIASAIADDHTSHAGYYSFTGLDGMHDGQVMRYEYSFGDFAVAGSIEIDDNPDSAAIPAVAPTPGNPGSAAVPAHIHDDPTLGIGVKWSGEMGGAEVSAGLGYQTGSLEGVDVDATALSLTAAMANGFQARLGYATGNIGYDTSDWDWLGVSLGYKMDALTVQALWGQWTDNSAGAPDADGWGLVANYDLGGGAVAMFGYGDGGSVASPYAGAGSHWSAGLGLSF